MDFRWTWTVVVGLGVALAAACSGESGTGPGGKGGTGSGATSGVGATGGASGNTGNVGGKGGNGGTAGTGLSGGEAGEGATGGTGIVTGGASGLGGTAGFSGLGGLGGVGAVSGLGGVAGTAAGGAGSGGTAPTGWFCSFIAYGDGTCDCGCGIPDSDCDENEVVFCDRCNAFGSCAGTICPGRIDPDDPANCVPVPVGWRCQNRNYMDGTTCDCGCGQPDPDCADETVSSCETCNVSGSCAYTGCPGTIDPDDNANCIPIPDEWYCQSYMYGNFFCDCGCGALDIDCDGTGVEFCETCWAGCDDEDCPGHINPVDNTSCIGPPRTWTCQDRFYEDGSLCHCGCGAIDPDCDTEELASCDRCNVEGSCSMQGCPGTINPNSIDQCYQPDPPPGWTCYPSYYADGYQCDCGCGVMDLDCRTDDIAECDACNNCHPAWYCSLSVDPNDTTQCLPPPAGWTCPDQYYGDGWCHCGCGATDLDCPSTSVGYCSYCPEEGCSRPDCRDIISNDNAHCVGGPPSGWTCSAVTWGDQACDCGCGVRDVDCPNGTVGACEFCNTPGGCSGGACPGTINPSDNATCN